MEYRLLLAYELEYLEVEDDTERTDQAIEAKRMLATLIEKPKSNR